MCGIAGGVLRNVDRTSAVARMAEALAHRGPDDAGFFHDPEPGVALGHRRLAILDLSSAGHQPMQSASGRYWAVHNGEIYNYRELRQELVTLGHAFRTGTDTEVLLAAFEQWGASSLSRLRGMWAFAIWDCHGEELFLTRDRLGIKPLYYAVIPEGLVFASEVGALLTSGLVPRELNKQAVWDYLSHGRVRQPETIAKGVRAVPAANMLRWRRGSLSMEPYWDLLDSTAAARSGAALPYPEAVLRMRELLDAAVARQLVADVPVGAFLSGGIDSTAVVGLTARRLDMKMRTFAIGFESEHAAIDELKWARLAADRLGTEHMEIVVSATAAAAAFEDVITRLDQPSIDGLNSFLVADATRKHVTVALSGIGGDELFAGYPHFRRIERSARWAPHGVPLLQRLLAVPAARLMPGRIRIQADAIADAPAARAHRLRLLMDENTKQLALEPTVWGDVTPCPSCAYVSALMSEDLDVVAAVTHVELHTYLRDTLLRDADAMSMAHALEVRPVLLDEDVVEYAFALPAVYKLNGGRTKRILIDALSDVLPPEIVARPKMGFELPLGVWARTSLRERFTALLASRSSVALFAPGFRRRLSEELDGSRRMTAVLWAVAVLLACIEHLELEAA
jgi:asparagine synthase (glutamine-hydrolysing)